MKRFQYTIRTMLFVVTGAAIFLCGYCVGFDSGRNSRFDDLAKLLQETIDFSSDWVSSGTINETGGGCSLLVTEAVSVTDPFVSTPMHLADNDPFLSPAH